MPILPIEILPLVLNPFTGKDVDTLLRLDDSYEQIPAPDINSVEKSERFHEKNFIVNKYKIKW